MSPGKHNGLRAPDLAQIGSHVKVPRKIFFSKIFFRIIVFLLLGILPACTIFEGVKTVKYIRYTVQKGDTVSSVASTFKVTCGEIIRINNLGDKPKLQPGQYLKIPYRGPGQTASKTSAKKIEADASSIKTVSGSSAKHYRGHLVWPVTGGRVSSTFGRRWFSFHEGVDIVAGYGVPIYAAHAGTVVYSGSGLRGYGNLVVIKGEGLLTVYAHNRSNVVKRGQKVGKGEKIAFLGSSGKSSGPHMHFETRIKNNKGLNAAVDPLAFY